MDDGYEADDFDLDYEADSGCTETTILRATFLKDGWISMTQWMPGLAESGPSGTHFRARERAGVAIADVRLVRTQVGEREVIVEFMAAGRAREAAEAALCAWASSTGYRRVWLPSGPVSRGGRRSRQPRSVPKLPGHLDGLDTGLLARGRTRRPLSARVPDVWTHAPAVESHRGGCEPLPRLSATLVGLSPAPKRPLASLPNARSTKVTPLVASGA